MKWWCRFLDRFRKPEPTVGEEFTEFGSDDPYPRPYRKVVNRADGSGYVVKATESGGGIQMSGSLSQDDVHRELEEWARDQGWLK